MCINKTFANGPSKFYTMGFAIFATVFCLISVIFPFLVLISDLPEELCEKTSNPPIFYCFHDVTTGGGRFDAFGGNDTLIRFCSSSCPARVRRCNDGEENMDMYMKFILPAMGGALATAIACTFVVRACLNRENLNLRTS